MLVKFTQCGKFVLGRAHSLHISRNAIKDAALNKILLDKAHHWLNNQLKQRGLEKLAEVAITEGFQGTVEPDVMYKYNEDFTIGDFVTFKDKYGNYGTPRIDEFTISDDENNGYYCYPTFVMLEE